MENNLYDNKKGIFELNSSDLSFNKNNQIVSLHEKFLNKSYLLLFYAPWCGHCKHMVNDITNLGEQLQNDNFVVGAVNCEKQKDVSDKFNIRGFPTIYLSVGNKTELYNGERTVEAFKNGLAEARKSEKTTMSGGSKAKRNIKSKNMKKNSRKNNRRLSRKSFYYL
jgi:thioredoxin-like negative regulator of GroEL